MNTMNYDEILASYKQISALISNPPPDIQYEDLQTALQDMDENLNYMLCLDPPCVFMNGILTLKDQVLALLKTVSGFLSHIEKQKLESASLQSPYAYNFIQYPLTQTHNKNNSGNIEETVMTETLSVEGFKDIAGMWELKEILKMMVLLPKKQPQLFYNRRMTNSILLFGPPGTGKTKIVHGIAAEANCLLYAVSVADIMQKYLGESEKTIKHYFETVRHSSSFSILFFDEIDSISQRRDSGDAGYSRRVLTEFMCQMNKLEESRNCVVIAATNCPWDLDPAVMRRFQRRICCPLPDDLERFEIIKLMLNQSGLDPQPNEWEILQKQTKGLSGSDIKNGIQQGLDKPLLDLQVNRLWIKTKDGFYEPCDRNTSLDSETVVCRNIDELPDNSVRAMKPTLVNILTAFSNVKPTVSKDDVLRYRKYNEQF